MFSLVVVSVFARKRAPMYVVRIKTRTKVRRPSTHLRPLGFRFICKKVMIFIHIFYPYCNDFMSYLPTFKCTKYM